MKMLDADTFRALMDQSNIKPKLVRELRLTKSIESLQPDDWPAIELLKITDRTGNRGVLLMAPDDDIFVVLYELSRGMVSRESGRAQPIICDFCRTWQSGYNAGSVSLRKDGKTLNSVTFLCCGDLMCSWHVRSKTDISKVSRAQLRENLNNEQRVERLKARLRIVTHDLMLV